MKTTNDLPDELFQRGKIAAAERRLSFKSLVIDGLETVLNTEANNAATSQAAIARLKRGYRLGNRPFSREEIHAR